MFKTKNIIRAASAAMLSLALITSVMAVVPSGKVAAAGQSYTFTEAELAKNPVKAINDKIKAVKDKGTADSPYVLKFPAGKTYSLDHIIRLYSNITLDLNGSTLKMIPTSGGEPHNIIRFDEEYASVTGYAYSNVTVTNGTLDGNKLGATLIKMAHGKNITISDLTIMNTTDYHLSEFAAIDGLNITNCTFKDMVWANNWKQNDDSCYEAIQLDILTPVHFEYYEYQALPMKNIKITGCTFENVPRAIGSHTAILNAPLTNITIKNNTISGCKSAAIQGCYWSNVTITGNTITDAPRGIALYSVNGDGGEDKSSASGTFLATNIEAVGGHDTNISGDYKTPEDSKITISNNKITLNSDADINDYQHTGITVGGMNYKKQSIKPADNSGDIPTGNYFIKGVTIEDNTITTSGFGVRTWNAQDIKIKGNTINGSKGSTGSDHGIAVTGECKNVTVSSNSVKNTKGDGIQISKSTGVTIKSNTISSSAGVGIRVCEGSTTSDIASNKVSKAASTGILLSSKAVTGSISKNTVSDSGDAGIKICNSSVCADITGNTVKNSAKNGIILSSSGSTNGAIAGNTVSGSKANAITITDSGKATAITGNTVPDTTGDHAILLSGAASVSGDISGNTVTKVAKNGIYVSAGSKLAGAITGNTVSEAGEAGIKVSNANSQAKEIRDNNVSSSGTCGIMITDGAKITGDIISNTIATSGKHGISVSDLGVSVANIKNNNITDPAGSGIIVSFQATVGTISSNTVKNAGDAGIKICENAGADTVSDNTLDSPKVHGITLTVKARVRTAIKSNKISSAKQNGIVVGDGSTCATIDSNTIKAVKMSGITVLKGAKVTVSIRSNNISSPEGSGIKVSNEGSAVAQILSNEISGAKEFGLMINNGATVSDAVTSNVISKTKKTAIMIVDNASASTLSKNTITDAGEAGIKVAQSGSSCKDIVDNNISKTGTQGIMISDKAKVTNNVSDNTIKNSGDAGIKVCQDGTSCKNITDNKIDEAGTQGIMISDKAKVSNNISDNKIQHSGDAGIKVCAKAKTKSITKNNVNYTKGDYSIMVSSGASVTKVSNNSISFPSSKKDAVKVDSQSKVTTNSGNSVFRFSDVVNTSDFWFKPTYSLASKGVVKGYDNQTKFKPANDCTRAQMVTFLWRLSGCPAPKAKTCKFSDIKQGDYFYKAVIWGNEQGIVEGYKDGTFGPQIVCMRKHAVTFMWRMAGKPEPKTKKNKFSDVKPTDYFYQATLWASEKNILAGYTDGTFKPNGKCLRRQMVTFLDKYDTNVIGSN